MADKLWYVTGYLPMTSAGAPGTTWTHIDDTNQGGLPRSGLHFSTEMRFENGECSVGAGGVTISGATGSGSSYVAWLEPWNFAGECSEQYFVPCGTMEFFLSITSASSAGVFLHWGGDNFGVESDINYGTIPLGIGFVLRIESGRVFMDFGGYNEVLTFDTGLSISGTSHVMIQTDRDNTHFTIGVDGDTFTTSQVPAMGFSSSIYFGNIREATFNPINNGCDCTFSHLRMTMHRERYGNLPTGQNTYTVPAIGYPGFSAPSNPLTLTHTIGTNPDNQLPQPSKLQLSVTNVTGGTPPYTYEWVDWDAGRLDWMPEVGPGGDRLPSIILNTREFSMYDAFTFMCIVEDADGTVATTHEIPLQWWYLEGNTFGNNILDTTVYAKLGEPFLMSPIMTDNGRIAGWGPKCTYPGVDKDYPYQWPLRFPTQYDKMPIFEYGGASTEGVHPVDSYGNGFVFGGYVNAENSGGWADALYIDEVTLEHDGLYMTHDYFNQSTFATLTLRVYDETRADGWWRDLQGVEQEIEPGQEDFFRTFQEGWDAADAFINSSPTSQESNGYENQVVQFVYNMSSFNPGNNGANEYNIGRYARWATTEFAQVPTNTYNIPAEFAWNMNGTYWRAMSTGVDLAYNHADGYYGSGPWKLPDNGSEFTAIFRMAYEATWDGFMDGAVDRLAANPEFTTYDGQGRGKYVGTPLRNDYLARYLQGYQYGFNP